MFKSCVIIRKPRSTLYSYWLSVNLPNLMLSVLSLIDAKPNTLVEYVKRIGAVLARNKGSNGKVSTRQLTSWRLTDVTLTNVTLLMWLCWLRILINHGEGLVLTNERVAEACVIEPQWGLQENLPWILRGRRRSRANIIFRYMYSILHRWEEWIPSMGRVDSIDGKSGFHRWEEEIPLMGRADSTNRKSGFHWWEEDEQNLLIPLMRWIGSELPTAR